MRSPLTRLADWRYARRYRRGIGSKSMSPEQWARMYQFLDDVQEAVEVMKAEKGHRWREGAQTPGYGPWPRQGNWWV